MSPERVHRLSPICTPFEYSSGKPVVRLGRKATGPEEIGAAGLPKVKEERQPVFRENQPAVKGAVVMFITRSRKNLKTNPIEPYFVRAKEIF
jgi:hypothetical protein